MEGSHDPPQNAPASCCFRPLLAAPLQSAPPAGGASRDGPLEARPRRAHRSGPSRREGFQPPPIESGQAEPTLVELSAIPRGVYDPNTRLATGRVAGRIHSPLSDEVTARLRQEALRLPATLGAATSLASIDIEPMAPTAGVSFDSLDLNDCCGGGANVPPDPELAVGPNHIIAVVNVAFEIYDKSGKLLSGPTTFASFFPGKARKNRVRLRSVGGTLPASARTRSRRPGAVGGARRFISQVGPP